MEIVEKQRQELDRLANTVNEVRKLIHSFDCEMVRLDVKIDQYGNKSRADYLPMSKYFIYNNRMTFNDVSVQYDVKASPDREYMRLMTCVIEIARELDDRVMENKKLCERLSYACLLYTSPSPRD